MQAILALDNGMFYQGRSIGVPGERCAELVFNTSMSGYQEILTDPSYRGQCVVMTAPMIGTYGTMAAADEGHAPAVEGFLVREACDAPAFWGSRETLSHYLGRHGVVAIAGIDTRALVRQIRQKGLLHACLATGDVDPAELIEKARRYRGLDGCDTVQHVTTPARYTFAPIPSPGAPRVAVLDCGIKRSMLRQLAESGCGVEVFPAATSAAELLTAHFDGVLLSNGPGDPEGIPAIIDTVRSLVGQIPLFGICLGHQLLGLALGGRTYKLPFGHHGGNHPVKNLLTGRVEITAQNHNFAVDPAGLADVEVTHVNLFDRTVEGMRHRRLPLFSIQYHPEAAPGPHDSTYLFDQFKQMMAAHRGALVAG